MKPERSPHRTACLPILLVTSRTVASTSGAVDTVLTTSTSGMIEAGLKKCRPMTSAGREVAAAHSMTAGGDVVVANRVPGAQLSYRLAVLLRLIVRRRAT